MIIMGWFDILKKLTRDEMGQVRPYIKDELEEGKKRIRSVRNRYRYKLGREPTEEELREELSKPPKVKRPRGGQRKMRPKIRDHPAYRRLIARFRREGQNRVPTEEELRQEISNPTKLLAGRQKRVPPQRAERFELFDNIKLYLESQNITPTVMNILEELSDSDKTNREKDINDIGEYLRTQRMSD